MRVLIDTNIILDVLQARQPHLAEAVAIFGLCETGKLDAYVSAITFNNVYYILRKQIGNPAALAAIRQLRLLFNVAELSAATIDHALDLGMSDFEDAIQVACARAVGANLIITRDTTGFSNSPVNTVNPAAAISAVTP